jgi:chromosome partitioning protein
MITITLAAAKGGVGKSTLAAILAVQAAKDGTKVGIMDWDRGQGSIAYWHAARGNPRNPALADAGGSPSEVVDWNHDQDWAYLFIDTPPRDIDEISEAVDAADFVIIPVHASTFDVLSSQTVAELCTDAGKPFAFLLNEVDPRQEKLTASAVSFLKKLGPVLDAQVQNRAAYVKAINVKGKTGPETNAQAAAEIETLWKEVKRRAARAVK